MLNRSASLAMLTSFLKALPGKFDIKNTHLVFSITYTHCSHTQSRDEESKGHNRRRRTKPVFGVSNKVSFKPVSSGTETSWKIEISVVAS